MNTKASLTTNYIDNGSSPHIPLRARMVRRVHARVHSRRKCIGPQLLRSTARLKEEEGDHGVVAHARRCRLRRELEHRGVLGARRRAGVGPRLGEGEERRGAGGFIVVEELRVRYVLVVY